MPFSEKVKKEVRDKSRGKCVICKEPFVEIHHIIPSSCGGDDSIDKAVALCAGCHDKYGDSEKKRKQIREMRDQWYKDIEEITKQIILLETDKDEEKDLAIYYKVSSKTTFEEAAMSIFSLLKAAIIVEPKKKRPLYLEIEGHRNTAGGYDNDMFELQSEFLLNFLGQYFQEITMPLIHIKNKKPQNNDLNFDILKIIDEKERLQEV